MALTLEELIKIIREHEQDSELVKILKDQLSQCSTQSLQALHKRVERHFDKCCAAYDNNIRRGHSLSESDDKVPGFDFIYTALIAVDEELNNRRKVA